MKKSISTFLKHTAQDKVNRSANPAVVRASTVFFKSMQELLKHRDPSKNKRVDYYDYGRAGTQTTTQLQNIIVELEKAHHVFLTPSGFAAVALSIMSICRPGDEIVVTDSVYFPTRMITSKLLKEFGVKAQFYDPDNLQDLKNKVTNVIVSDSINRAYVKDIDFNSLKSTGKVTGIMEPGTNACATFVNKFTDKFNGVGDAWLSYRLDTKLGDTIFSKFKGLDKSQQETAIKLWKQLHKEGGGKIEDGSNKTNGNVKSFIKGLANKGGNPSDLQLDDIVGIFYEPSTHHEQAFYHGGEAWFKGGEAGSNINDGNAWGMNTHLGIVGAIKDGKPLIFHNIGGNVISEPPSNLSITWVKRHSQSTPIDASTIKNV